MCSISPDSAPSLQAGELHTELVKTAEHSTETVQSFEQTIAELTAERRAAEQGTDQARQAEAAMRAQMKQLQGELAAMASEREWSQDSTGALQVSIPSFRSRDALISSHEFWSIAARLADPYNSRGYGRY